MIARSIRLLLLICSLTMVLAACGDDDDADGDATEPTSGSSPTTAVTEPTEVDTATEPAATADTGAQSSDEPLQWSSAPEMQLEEGVDYRAVLHTNKGDITVDILEDVAPIAANNFVFLGQQGYYTNVPFHRVIDGFMIQGGDPTGTGTGGPGYTIQDEPVVGEYTRGTMAMARTAAPNSAGSQFFIMHADYPLQPDYVIFGQVTEGIEVVDAIATTPVGPSVTGEPSSPLEPLVLESVDILTD